MTTNRNRLRAGRWIGGRMDVAGTMDVAGKGQVHMSERTATTGLDQDEESLADPVAGPGPGPGPAPGPAPRAAAARLAWAWWGAVGAAALVIWVVLTWPLSVNLDEQRRYGQAPPAPAIPTFHGGDNLQTIAIYSAVIDNVRNLREPFLDLREGAAGPAPLRTASLDVPWTAVIALLWPVTGLVAAYNLTLLLSTVAAALAAFGLLRRHTRWPLLAAAGALLYAAAPHRMWQLVGHFNALMSWAFPLAAWAFEVMLERWHAARAGAGATRGGGRGWVRPAVALVAVALTVALSGEFHLALYMVGMLTFFAGFAVLAARIRRVVPPWLPVTVTLVTAGAVAAYALFAFGHVFRGDPDGGNGTWAEVFRWATGPKGLVVHRGGGGETIVYVGWLVAALAAAGLVAGVARGRRDLRALAYALLLPAVLFFTFGPRLAYGPIQPYRFLFDRVEFLSFQRVPQRLMVLTMLVILVLAVAGADWLAGLVAGRLAARTVAAGQSGRRGWVRHAAAVLTVLVTLTVLYDYRIDDPSRVVSGETDNAVIARLAATGGGGAGGPILGLPILPKASPLNSITTYTATLSNRASLNAYNQTSAPWLDRRIETLAPLNRGIVTDAALTVLRETGTRQVVVFNEPGAFATGREWQATINRLVASGTFEVDTIDAPMVLLTRTR